MLYNSYSFLLNHFYLLRIDLGDFFFFSLMNILDNIKVKTKSIELTKNFVRYKFDLAFRIFDEKKEKHIR